MYLYHSLGLSLLHHELGGKHAVHVDEHGRVLAVRCETNLDLVRRDRDALDLHLAAHELLGLVVIAEGRVEIAFYVDMSLVDILGYGSAGYQHGKAEKIVRRHDRRLTTLDKSTKPVRNNLRLTSLYLYNRCALAYTRTAHSIP